MKTVTNTEDKRPEGAPQAPGRSVVGPMLLQGLQGLVGPVAMQAAAFVLDRLREADQTIGALQAVHKRAEQDRKAELEHAVAVAVADRAKLEAQRVGTVQAELERVRKLAEESARDAQSMGDRFLEYRRKVCEPLQYAVERPRTPDQEIADIRNTITNLRNEAQTETERANGLASESAKLRDELHRARREFVDLERANRSLRDVQGQVDNYRRRIREILNVSGAWDEDALPHLGEEIDAVAGVCAEVDGYREIEDSIRKTTLGGRYPEERLNDAVHLYCTDLKVEMTDQGER